ncbi:MAG: DUF1446 domain-containing protein [Planctomycetaceae bacterium]|nr:DUF1446 domain-containing protein [Planctomycetaceae bacterium]
MRCVRIGSGAGFANDRVEPAVELLEKGNLDYIMFECLGERTVAFAMLRKKHDPQKGYDNELEYRMGKMLDAYKRSGAKTKLISNMGAANPIGAAKVIAKMAEERGLGHMKIAAVVGDDVLDRLDKYMDRKTMETEEPLSSIEGSIVNANAYIGCSSIVEALQAGADMVITGRAADPSLVVGPLVYEYKWKMDDWDMLGKATIAGHLLECSAQVSGGFFADPGYKEVPDIWRIGFPICNFYENGDMEITKVDGSGGLVSEMTVKEQLLYEIQDPSAYITPDVIADYTEVEVKELAPNLVSVKGGKGKPKTGLLKINVGYNDCFIGEGEVTYGGHSCVERAKLGADTVLKRLELCGVEYSEIRVDLIGLTSLFKEKVGGAMTTGRNSEIRLRVAARTKDAFNADRVGYEVETLLVCGPQSAGGARRYVREIISLASILIDESDVNLEISYYGGAK